MIRYLYLHITDYPHMADNEVYANPDVGVIHLGAINTSPYDYPTLTSITAMPLVPAPFIPCKCFEMHEIL